MKGLNFALLLSSIAILSACNSGDSESAGGVAEQPIVTTPPSAEVVAPNEKIVTLTEDGANDLVIEDRVEGEILSNFDTLRPNESDGMVESAAINPSLEDGWLQINVEGVRVIDGDTVEVLIPGEESERVRLIGIDAPESKQAYGQDSKATLQDCIDGKDVSVIYKEKDRYGRLLGKVMAGNTDCNFMQVAVGSAWHYKKYESGQPNNDKNIYSDAEKVAKLHSSGLWFDPNHQEPWEYRKQH